LQEPKLCRKPVYRFERAFVADKNIPEFCLIYSEADDPEEIFISVNPGNTNKFKKILNKYKNYKIIYHGENDKGELCESFYYDCRGAHCASAKIAQIPRTTNGRPYKLEDEPFLKAYGEDDYFHSLYKNFIEDKIYHDCGIIGTFDENEKFAGYLAYYEIAENIRDVSYIYVGEQYRGRGYGKDLLNFFVNKNIEENKISYYSCAENDISIKLAKSCGFLSCAKRWELNIK